MTPEMVKAAGLPYMVEQSSSAIKKILLFDFFWMRDMYVKDLMEGYLIYEY